MAKKKINKFIFEPGISKDANLFPNAVALLIANRSFIQAQVVAFINAQIAANIPPYNNYTYEPSKCVRDVGFFIDAIAHDLRYGGNVKIRQVADYFWIDGRPMIRGNPAPEITGQQYIRDIINNFIFTNTAVTPTFGQTSVAQTFIQGSDGETGAAAVITSEFEILADVIENGVSALPEKITGVSAIRLSGKYDLSDILLITDTANGEVIYNFADPSNSIKIEHKKLKSSGNGEPVSDVDFRTYIQTSGSITELYLSKDTSNLTDITSIQIFVENDVTTIRPWDFGTDAIERMRVAAPQAMLDADFEYGLQPTKWQQLSLLRSYPSIYEIPGTDLSISSIVTDASTTTGDFGASLITVRTVGNHGLRIGDAITVKGLNTNINGFSRAEGSFLVARILSSNIFEYFSSARVGTVFGDDLFSSSIQIRKGNFYTGANIGNPTFSILTQGVSIQIETVFDTAEGSDRLLAFSGTGTAPTIGSSITGLNIPPGTAVSGIIGSVPISTILSADTTIGQVFVDVIDVTGIQQGMAVNNGLGVARSITSISGNRLNLDGSIDVVLVGSIKVFENVSGNNLLSQGVDAAFNVSITGGNYQVTDRDDSTSNGQNYEPGDLLLITGNLVGGTTPTNDIFITVTEVDSQGTITNFTFNGAAPAIENSFIAVPAAITGKSGTNATFEVTRNNGNYSAQITNSGTNYFQGTVIKITGDNLGGTTPENDLEIVVNQVSGGGNITEISTIGTAILPDQITAFPTITVSEFSLGPIPAGTILTTGAVATVEVEFDSAHGLLPGTSITSNITSNPNAEVTVIPETLPSSGTWTGVGWNGEVFFAARSGSNLTAVSADGETWTAGGNLPSTVAWSSVAGGVVSNTRYLVAVASNNNTAAWSDDNGVTWNSVTLPTLTTTTWNRVTYFKGVFVAVRAGSNGAARSVDGGQTWTAVTLPGSNLTWTSVTGVTIGDQDIMIAIASGTATAAYSSNLGVTWTSITLPASSTWRDVAGGNGILIAIAANTQNIAISRNGLTWTASQLPLSTTWESIDFDGRENFIAISTGTAAAITTTGLTNEWDQFTVANGSWRELTAGGSVSDPFFVSVGTGTNVVKLETTPANHQLAGGSFVISEVPSLNIIRYPARSVGVVNDNIDITGEIYVRPDTFFTHRPYDGGVQLGTGGPQHGAQAVRQSKKYIRYQSGKGIMFTTGALFAPSYNIASAVADGTSVNSVITFTTDETDHGLQPGGIIEIKGMESFEYNGVYTVSGIVDSKTFRVNSNSVLSDTVGTLGPDTTVSVRNWHGATVRSGAFDDQNGIFWQYDGQKLAVCVRTSTLQLAGTISVDANSNTVTGTGTRFKDQLTVGDKVVIKGMSHTVSSIESQTSLTFTPDYRGASNLVGGKLSLTRDTIVNQDDWNLDTLDGTGPSGYNVDPTKMQMIGMQYSWYAVGFIEYMLRGDDGKFIIFHRIKNSNVNTEAYMRTANLPVRYEVENASARSYLREAMTDSQNFMILANADRFPISGTVYVDNELISYSGKSGDRLLNLSRSAQLANFAAGQNRSYSAGPAAAHLAKAGVILVSCTITPVISHWGSALLTDGLFDEDRGYLFSYTATGVPVSTTKATAFLIRLAPSVSNAITGDLGERELLNRAQLLLKEISITADTGSGGIVIEGVLNPQNYPENPGDIGWTDLTSSGAGGQPSFAQIAPGGSVNWRSEASTTTALVQGELSATFAVVAALDGNRSFRSNSNQFFLTAEDSAASGIRIGDVCASRFPAGTTITSIGDPEVRNSVLVVRYRTSSNASNDVNGPSDIVIRAAQTANSYPNTNFLFFTETSFIASGASLGTRVSPTDTKFPAGTAINGIEQRTLGPTTIVRASFTQTSTTTIAAAATVTFDFQINNALPGEQVFSFISNPGDQATLDLTELKELTTTAIGGRGAFPNGPDVLAINVFKVSGNPVNANIILRWGEAQA
jgi:hypothetical protein